MKPFQDTIDYKRRHSLKLLSGAVASTGMLGIMPNMNATGTTTYMSHTAEGKQVLDVQKMIVDAIAFGRHTIVMPPGRFRVATERVMIRNTHDLTIEGAGPDRTTLVTDMWAGTAFSVLESQRITLRGFSVDRDPVPFVQASIMKISDVAPNMIALDFEVHDGYPGLTDKMINGFNGCGQFFDKSTRLLKRPDRWFGLHGPENIVRVDDFHGRIQLSTDWKGRVEVGDHVVLKSGNGSAFVLLNSDSIRMEDIAILASGSLGVGAHFLTGENYFRFAIKPGPNPEGATEPRLIATNADGIQYLWSPGAVTFEHCDLSFTGDDGINITTSSYFHVVQIQSPTRFRASAKMQASIVEQTVAMSKSGDIVRPERAGTFEPLGDFPLRSILYEGTHKTENGPELAYVTVELQQAPPEQVAVGDILFMRKFLPKHFAIRNSHFRETRARGLLIGASNGVIENNVIERTALAGMSFSQEYAVGWGGDWVSNILVRNNTIHDVCFNDGAGFTAAAALQVLNRPAAIPNDPSHYFSSIPAHRNITIQGNEIDGSDAAGILINEVNGGEVRDNTVRNTNLRRGRTVDSHTSMPIDVPYAITIMNSTGVHVEGDKVFDLGPYAKGEVGDMGIYPATRVGDQLP